MVKAVGNSLLGGPEFEECLYRNLNENNVQQYIQNSFADVKSLRFNLFFTFKNFISILVFMNFEYNKSFLVAYCGSPYPQYPANN